MGDVVYVLLHHIRRRTTFAVPLLVMLSLISELSVSAWFIHCPVPHHWWSLPTSTSNRTGKMVTCLILSFLFYLVARIFSVKSNFPSSTILLPWITVGWGNHLRLWIMSLFHFIRKLRFIKPRTLTSKKCPHLFQSPPKGAPVLDHPTKSVSLFWHPKLMMPGRLVLHQQNRNTKNISFGFQNISFFSREASKNLSWKKLKLCWLSYTSFLFWIIFEAGTGDWTIAIVIFKASSVLIWPLDASHASARQSVSCRYRAGIGPWTSWLLRPYVRFHCLESGHHCPWWEHQGLRQGTPDAPGRCYSLDCESTVDRTASLVWPPFAARAWQQHCFCIFSNSSVSIWVSFSAQNLTKSLMASSSSPFYSLPSSHGYSCLA